MREKARFRIIYLKNDESRKYQEGIAKKYNVIVSGRLAKGRQDEGLTPNLVHLSARLQDDVFQSEKARALTANHRKDNVVLELGLEEQENLKSKEEEMKSNREQKITKFLEMKELSLKRQRNTIKNLIGSIHFSSSKRKEKIISSFLKKTMRNASASARVIKNDENESKHPIINNRDLMQSDFNTFLNNKYEEKTKQQPTLQQHEEEKLKKLSIINPEQPNKPTQGFTPQQLNLYHFLTEKLHRERISNNIRNRSSSSIINALSKSRFDKKMFNFNSALKTEEEDFDWSKMKPNSKHFSIKENQ